MCYLRLLSIHVWNLSRSFELFWSNVVKKFHPSYKLLVPKIRFSKDFLCVLAFEINKNTIICPIFVIIIITLYSLLDSGRGVGISLWENQSKFPLESRQIISYLIRVVEISTRFFRNKVRKFTPISWYFDYNRIHQHNILAFCKVQGSQDRRRPGERRRNPVDARSSEPVAVATLDGGLFPAVDVYRLIWWWRLECFFCGNYLILFVY